MNIFLKISGQNHQKENLKTFESNINEDNSKNQKKDFSLNNNLEEHQFSDNSNEFESIFEQNELNFIKELNLSQDLATQDIEFEDVDQFLSEF